MSGPARKTGGRASAALPALLVALSLALLPALPASPAWAQAGGALDADAAAGAVKVCSPLAMPRWRSMTPVPKTWTFLDCMSFSGQMGATDFQLGCLFADVTPYAQKFAWGPVVRIDDAALAGPKPPLPNCGW